MALNNSHRMVISQRREAVARLRLRGRTQREIADVLAREGHRNAETGEPWSLGTINADLKALDRQWQAAAAAETRAIKARQLAEIQEAKRLAWEYNDVNQVRLLVKLEMELVGTEAPKRTEVSGRDGAPVQVEHGGETHGDLDHLTAVLSTLVGVGAVELPGPAAGDDAEDDGLHPAPADG